MNMKKEPHLTIIGCDPKPRTNLKKLHIEGWVPDDKVPKIYRRSDVFVLPSLEEGSALVVYEAMASGLPCIVTPECGSIITDGEEGLIIESKNIEQIEKAIQYFIDNPTEIKRMGEKARHKVENEYTWDHFKKRFIKELEAIGHDGHDNRNR
jgi:glycosyltransferase involved in cell wall biosynthesis